jgi:hypothetical protein
MIRNKKIPRPSRDSSPETMVTASGRGVVLKPESQSSSRSGSGVIFTDAELIAIGYEALVLMMARDPKRWRLERRAARMLRLVLTERGVDKDAQERLISVATQQWQSTEGWRGKCKAHRAQH